jgi:hypothetical protein
MRSERGGADTGVAMVSSGLAWPLPAFVNHWLPPASVIDPALRWPLFTQVFANKGTVSRSLRQRRWLPWRAWTLLVVAAARAELIQAPTGTAVSGRSLLMAMDASASMRSAHLRQESAMAVIRRTARAFIFAPCG